MQATTTASKEEVWVPINRPARKRKAQRPHVQAVPLEWFLLPPALRSRRALIDYKPDTTLERLPVEILTRILERCDAKTVCNVAQVCRILRNVADDVRVWRFVAMREFGTLVRADMHPLWRLQVQVLAKTLAGIKRDLMMERFSLGYRLVAPPQ